MFVTFESSMTFLEKENSFFLGGCFIASTCSSEPPGSGVFEHV
jgi:hypothetical protein